MSEVARPTSTLVAARPYVVLVLSLVVAALGVFPYNALFLVPLTASLTLAGLDPRVRATCVAVCVAALVLGVTRLAGIS